VRGAISRSLLLAASLALGNCASRSEPPAPPVAPEQALIGTTKARLMECAGEPATAYPQGEREILTYRTSQVVGEGYLQNVPRLPVVGAVGTGGKGTEIACEATVVLKASAVEVLSFRTDPPQSSQNTLAICTPIVQRCL
jgi:hypothetical protein